MGEFKKYRRQLGSMSPVTPATRDLMPSLGGTHGNPTPIPDPTYMHIHTLKNEINLPNKPLKDCTRQSVGGRIYFGSRSEEMGSFMMVKTWESSEQDEQVFATSYIWVVQEVEK